MGEKPEPSGSPGLRHSRTMFAVYAESTSNDDPLSGLVVGERPEPDAPDDWVTRARYAPPR